MHRLFATSVILFASLLTGSAWAAPKLVVEQPTFDFGEIPQGETVRHVFSFTNSGDKPLHIEKVHSSCGCTAALVSTKTLAPGDRGEVQANFDSTRFRGEVSKTISLYSNDPGQPVAQLVVKGKVQEVLSVTPSLVNLGQVAEGKTAVAQVSLQNRGSIELRLDKVQTTSSDLVVKLATETLSAGQHTVINIELTPRPGQDRFSGYVMLPAQGSLRTDLRIPVYADIRQQAN